MQRMRRGWRWVAVAVGAGLVVLISGCSGDTLSLVVSLLTTLLDGLASAATTSA